MSSAREELRRLIQAHVDPAHREHAIKLLDAIVAGSGQMGAGSLPGGGGVSAGTPGGHNAVGGLFNSSRGNGDLSFGVNAVGGNGHPISWSAPNSGQQGFAWGGGAGFVGGPGHTQSWPSSGFVGSWGISPTSITGGGVSPLGVPSVTGPSSLEGDVDQAMLNLALEAPAPTVFGGVSWNSTPVPSFDLVDSSTSNAESRFGSVFQIPPASGDAQNKPLEAPRDQQQQQQQQQAPQQPQQAQQAVQQGSLQGQGAQPQQGPSSGQPAAQAMPQAQTQTAPQAQAQQPQQALQQQQQVAVAAQAQHPAKFSSVVGGTAVPRPAQPAAVAPALGADKGVAKRAVPAATASSTLEQQRRDEANRAEAKRAEAARAAGQKAGVDPKGANNPKVKLRGLPYGSTIADVLNFFRGFGVIEGSVTFGVNSEGRPSGEAWVSFNRLEDARRAVREKDRHHMGDRYVELFLLNEGGGVAGRGYGSK